MDLQTTWHTLFVQNSGRNSRDGGERQPPEGGWVKILYLMLLPLLFFFYLLHLDLFFFFSTPHCQTIYETLVYPFYE